MKKTKLLSIFAFCGVFTCSAVLIGNGAVRSLSADTPENEEWHYYPAVEATFDHPGSRAYWVSCSTHIVRLSTPESGHTLQFSAPS